MTATSTEAFRKPPLLRQLTTVAAGASGSALFLWLAVPGGGISGAMLVVTLMTVFGIAVRIEGGLRTIAMVASGVTLGAAVTPETLRGIATYPGSLAIMAVGVAATTLAGTAFLCVFAGWSRATALLATSPGAFSYIISVAPRVKGDVPRIVVVQMFRVLILMAVLPMLVVETASLSSCRSGIGQRTPVPQAGGQAPGQCRGTQRRPAWPRRRFRRRSSCAQIENHPQTRPPASRPQARADQAQGAGPGAPPRLL